MPVFVTTIEYVTVSPTAASFLSAVFSIVNAYVGSTTITTSASSEISSVVVVTTFLYVVSAKSFLGMINFEIMLIVSPIVISNASF